MIKMKIAAVVTALFAMFGLSSCLDSEGSGMGYGSEYVKVNVFPGRYTFESKFGYTINPINGENITETLNSTYALISYQYDMDAYPQGATEVDATLTGLVPVTTKYVTPPAGDVDEYGNAPIRMVALNSYEYYPVQFWDEHTMFLPVYYFIKGYSDETDQQTELKSHSFELFYDANDSEAIAGDLILRLRHRVTNSDVNKERTTLTANIFHYDLNNVLMQYGVKNNGETPKRIVIEYSQNIYSGDDSSSVNSTRVEIDYEALVDAFEKK